MHYSFIFLFPIIFVPVMLLQRSITDAVAPGSFSSLSSFIIFLFDMLKDFSTASSAVFPFNKELTIMLDGSRNIFAVLSLEGLADHSSFMKKLNGVL